MQDQQRTNIPEGEWASCKNVTLRDGVLYCSLERNRTYVLTEAYENDLHIRFANANTDDDLIAFVRGWGPLYIPNGQIPPNGVVSVPLDHCRTYQRQIKALLGALTAFKWAQGEREALSELVKAECAILQPYSLDEIFPSLGITSPDWLKDASLPQVRAATNRLVRSVTGASFALDLNCKRTGTRRLVEAGWTFLNLEEALRWMIWYDEFTKHPVVCCPECRRVFRGETKRVRKYCSEKCGHKATARVSMQKKRANDRTERK
jgi:hypothetical protein